MTHLTKRHFLLLGTVIFLLNAGHYVFHYSHDIPQQDEWAFVVALKQSSVDWIFEKHYEHRYLFGRAVYFFLWQATGSFHSGKLLTLGLLLAASWLLQRAAVRLRGKAQLIDLAFPCLLLHVGQHENLLMGYQIVFTFTTFFVALLLLESTRQEPSPLIVALILVPIVLGGGIGLALTAPLSVWCFYLVCRTPRGVRRLSAAVLLFLVLASLGVMGWELAIRPRGEPIPLRQSVMVTIDFLRVGLGPAAVNIRPSLGYGLVLLEGITFLVLIHRALVIPADRPFALCGISVLAGVGLVGVAIGLSRPAADASRYMSISLLGPCVVFLTLARYGSCRWGRITLPVFVAAAVLLQIENARIARQFGWTYQVRYSALLADARRGVPVDIASERHFFFPIPEYRESFQLLAKSGAAWARGLSAHSTYQSTPDIFPDAQLVGEWNPIGSPTAPKSVILAPERRHWKALRLTYRCTHSDFWRPYRITWKKGGGSASDELFLWLVPGTSTMTFWIDDVTEMVELEAETPNPGLEVVKFEFLRDGS